MSFYNKEVQTWGFFNDFLNFLTKTNDQIALLK
jgi:hypothetical protein